MGEIRTGKVSSINYDTGMIRVTYQDKSGSVTRELPMMNFGREYHMPEVGQSVAVAHLSNGSSRGVVMGTIWNRHNLPREGAEGIYRKDFSKTGGAAVHEYSEETGKMLIKAPNISITGNVDTEIEGATLTIGANIRVILDTPEMELTAEKATWGIIEMEVLEGTLKAAMTALELNLTEGIKINAEGDIFAGTEGALRAEITGDMAISTEGNISAEAVGDVSVNAEGNLVTETTGDMTLKTNGVMTLETKGTLGLKDGTYNTTLDEICRCLENLGQTVGRG